MGRRVAKFMVSPEVLVNALELPETVTILDIYRQSEFNTLSFYFVIEHHELPEVPEGGKIPEINPTINKVYWDWGVDG